ncbi:MAG: rhodanese-like domain-containing protein [Candidatus Eisenbacteria bacterium]
MSVTSPEPRRPRSPLGRDAAVLVLAGIALGVSFNALQAAQDSPRALDWLRSEPKLASLESVTGAATAPAAATATPAPAGATPADEPAPVPVAATTTAAPAGAKPRSADKPADKPGSSPAPAPPRPDQPPARPAAETPEGAATPAPVAAPLPEVPVTRDPLEVGLDFAKRFHEARAAVFVDARSAEEFAEGHIAGASNLPFDDVYKKPELAKAFDEHGVPIVVYCGGGDCDLAKSLAYALIEAGHKRVLVFKDGYPVWAAAGLPTAKGARP